MHHIYYNDQSYAVNHATDTVLDTLLKHKIDYPHACTIGTCQSCLIKVLDGEINPEAQEGLQPSLRKQQYALACQCRPRTDITIKRPNQHETSIHSNIIELNKLNHNVIHLRLSINTNSTNIDTRLFQAKAGQYINLIVSEQLIRSYSITNITEQYLDLHIKIVTDGAIANWLTQRAHVGSKLMISGPIGHCFYHNPDNKTFPIVLAATGTGLAPILGIAQDALKHKHNGTITLIHGGVNEDDLYLHQTLTMLHKTKPNFRYIPCVLHNSTNNPKTIQASIEDILVQQLNAITNDVRLFICGPKKTTENMKIKAFLAGVPSQAIYSDAFL